MNHLILFEQGAIQIFIKVLTQLSTVITIDFPRISVM